jgi:hypothetical protein
MYKNSSMLCGEKSVSGEHHGGKNSTVVELFSYKSNNILKQLIGLPIMHRNLKSRSLKIKKYTHTLNTVPWKNCGGKIHFMR